MLGRLTFDRLLNVLGVEDRGQRQEFRPQSVDETRQLEQLPLVRAPPTIGEILNPVQQLTPIKLTYATIARACQETPGVQYKCCKRRCLHELERDAPGWMELKKDELKRAVEAQTDAIDRNRLLRKLRGQRLKKGRVPYSERYVRVFQEIESALRRRDCCANARFEFVSKKFAYRQRRLNASVQTSSSASGRPSSSASAGSQLSRTILFEGTICCKRQCLGNVVLGTDALCEFIRRRDTAVRQMERQELVDSFMSCYPGVCHAAVVIALGVSRSLVQKRIKVLKTCGRQASGSTQHGLRRYRKMFPNYRLDPEVRNTLNRFFSAYLVGNPMSTTRMAHISSVLPVNGKQGLWKYFQREEKIQISLSTFKNVLKKWLGENGYTGVDRRTHVDHNVCPSCKNHLLRRDQLESKMRELEIRRECASRDSSYHDLTANVEEEFERVELQRCQLEEERQQHAAHNTHCRRLISWWQHQAMYAACVSAEEDEASVQNRARNSMPTIAMVHCDGEAVRQIPHVRLESVGGGFEGRLIKNVAFYDYVTMKTENFFMSDMVRTESTSTLIDMILQRALQCRGEKVFVLVMDCCASNHTGTLWAFCVWLVDELRWFDAVLVEYYMPRHGKGPADQVFGGHRSTWKTGEILCEDQLGQAYVDASAGKENVSIIMASAMCDWKSYFDERSNGRVCQGLGIRDLAWNEIVVVRENIHQSSLHAEVKDYLSGFVSGRGWFRARHGYEAMHEYCVLSSVPKRLVAPSRPQRILKEVQDTEIQPGVFETRDYPVNRTNALKNGFNNIKFRKKGFEKDFEIAERFYGSAVVPADYEDENLRAHGLNLINRRPALREYLPRTGPIHPSVIELNMLLGRHLFNTNDIGFVSIVPEGKQFAVACVENDCAEYELLQAYSAEIENETSEFLTTAHVVEATTPGFSFDAPTPLCSVQDFIKCRQKFGNIEAYRKPPPPKETNVLSANLNRFLHSLIALD